VCGTQVRWREPDATRHERERELHVRVDVKLSTPGTGVGILDEEVLQQMQRGHAHALPRQSLAQRRLEVPEHERWPRLAADERVVEHEAKRVDVACDVGPGALQLLGRRV
jgi:hypothetical protein